MKKLFLLLFLISLNVFAIDQYVKIDSLNCANDQTFYNGPRASQLCGENCLPVFEKPFNCQYSKKVDAYNTKSQTVTCDDESDCQAKLAGLFCEDLQESPIKTTDTTTMEVYCTKFVQSHFAIDATKKAAYDAAQQAKVDKAALRVSTIKALKEAAVLKSFDQLTAVDKKLLMGLEITDAELGI